MKHQFSHSKIASKAAAIVALGFIAATSAQAEIKPSGGATSPIGLSYTGSVFGFEAFTSTGISNPGSYSAGSLQLATSSPVGTFATYCVELTQFTSGAFNTYNLTNFTPSVGTGLAHLYQVAGGVSPGNLSDSAAFQAAVWEIVYETSGSYGLGSGTFMGSFASNPGTTTQANTWLTAVNGFSGPTQYIAQQYVNVNQQDYLVISVPEPESYALLLAGLGLIGTIARRRGTRKAA